MNRNNLELIKYFRVNFINRNLIEGEAKIFVNTESSEYQFDINVFWNDKPKSLYDITSAIKALKIIGYNDAVDSLLDVSDNEQNRALLNFWNKFDSDKSTSYNELFTEFYSRIDYAKENFSSLRKDDGIKTDRERTFILFGKPDKIERTYTEVDNIVEIWTYNSLNEKIYFSDITGTGKFIRIK